MNPLIALRDLKAAGLPEPHAAAIVSLWATTHDTATETRRELDALRVHTDARFDRIDNTLAQMNDQLNGRMTQMDHQLNGQMTQMKGQLNEQMAQLTNQMNTKFDHVFALLKAQFDSNDAKAQASIAALETRMLTRIGTAALASVGAMSAIFWAIIKASK